MLSLGMRQISKTISSFLAWWGEQLGCLGTRRKSRDVRQTQNGLTLLVNQDRYEIISPNGECITCSQIVELSENLRSAAKGLSRRKKTVSLLMGDKLYLYRALSSAALPDYRISELAEFDMTVQTPFKRSDVTLITDARHGWGNGYFIVRNSILDPLFDKLRELKLHCQTISFAETPAPLTLPVSVNEPLFFRRSRSKLALVLSTIILPTMFAVTLVHSQLRHVDAIETLDVSIASLNTEVREIRKTLARRSLLEQRLASMLRLKRDAPSSVEVWEELSRILPDSSWLAALKIGDGSVIASGYSKSAASLIEIVSASSLFNEVAFDGPVVSIAGKDVQRFTIRAEIKQQ